MKKRPSLGVVQTHATQFDGPLFRYLAKEAGLNLTVYFTRPGGDGTSWDSELGTKRAWDIDVRNGYEHTTAGEGWRAKLALMHKALTAGHDLLIISGYLPAFHLAIALLGRVKGQPVGLRSDTVLSYGRRSGFRGLLKRIVLPAIMKLYKTGHPTGTLAAEYLVDRGMSPERLFPFPYNVDNDWLAVEAGRAKVKRDAQRRRHGIPADAYTVLGILKFVPREDPMTLLKAFTAMRASVPDAHLVLVGDGELRSQLETEIRTKNLDGCVHLLGYLPYSALPLYYSIADTFVHPAVKEQWGVSVNEAMVCGVPVIASRSVGAARDLINEGVSGFLFNPGDPDDLATKLASLAGSKRLREKAALEASLTMERWNYEQTSGSLERALDFVRAGRPGTAGEPCS